MAALFPASVAAAIDLFTAQNNTMVVLDLNCGPSDTAIQVDDASALPDSGYLTFVDTDEVIYFASRTGTVLNGVTRGADGTAAASHTAGVDLEARWNADYHNHMGEEITATQDNIRDRFGLNTNIVVPTGVTATITDGLGIGAALDSKAILSLSSTTKGFLPPRMTTTERDAIASPTTGLEIFNTTTSRKNIYTGANWRQVNLGAETDIVNADVNASAAIVYSKLNLAGGIVNNDVNASAAIAYSKLASLTSGQLLVGSAGNVATAVALSGDATLVASGAVTLATVNSNVGSFTSANITVNAKGLITAAASGTPGGVTAILADGGSDITGDVEFLSGDGITLTQLGQTITIDSTGSTASTQYVAYTVGSATGSYSGSTTVFDLPFSYVSDGKSIEVFYNGQQLKFTTDYAETTTTRITTTSALVSGAAVWFRALSNAGIVQATVVSIYREDYVVGTALNNYTGSLTVFDLVNTYNVAGNALMVTLDGDVQTIGASVDYLETDSNTVTFNNTLVAGQRVSFIWSSSAPSSAVNTGTANQIAYYAASTGVVSGNSLISATTNGMTITKSDDTRLLLVDSGESSTLAFRSDGASSSMGTWSAHACKLEYNATRRATIGSTGFSLMGTNTNDSATAGDVGEYIESVVGDTNTPTTAAWGDLTSISLTAGDWDVSANMFVNNVASFTHMAAGISTTSGNSASGLTKGSNYLTEGPVANTECSITIANYRVSLNSTTIYYFKMKAVFTGSTPQVAGRISARRMR